VQLKAWDARRWSVRGVGRVASRLRLTSSTLGEPFHRGFATRTAIAARDVDGIRSSPPGVEGPLWRYVDGVETVRLDPDG
jgi:hypothetical protein